MGIIKGYKKHCVGCNGYKWALEKIKGETDCRMHKRARGECPCGSCLVKVVCNHYCDLFYEVQINKKGIIL